MPGFYRIGGERLGCAGTDFVIRLHIPYAFVVHTVSVGFGHVCLTVMLYLYALLPSIDLVGLLMRNTFKRVQCIASWMTICKCKIKFTQPWIKSVTDKVIKLTGALL